MKGQQTLINEIFLFAFGLLLVVFVSFFFLYFNNWLTDITVKENLETVSALLSSSILKVYEMGGEGLIKIKIPQQINDKSYGIEALGNRIILYDLYSPQISAIRELFYISLNKNIMGSAVSSYGYIKIKFNNTNIEIGR